jgi:hypothetical protein
LMRIVYAFSVVWHISQRLVQERRDLTNTRTPVHVGMGCDLPVGLQFGDLIDLGIAGLGTHCRQVVCPR